jgi:hypothetical protein
MSERVHGLLSLGLTGIGIAIAAVVAFAQAAWLGLGYLALCGVAAVGILYAYCARCTCRAHCAHVIPGKLAGRFRRQKTGPYTPLEIAVVAAALLLLVGLPLTWLWRYPWLLVIFGALMAIAFFEIRLTVCRGCENVLCPMRPAGR